MTVKQHLPTTTTCPLCRQELLRVYVSPLSGGRWYNCIGCGFKGDSIEFYHKAHGLPDIRDTIFELIAKEILPMSRDEVTLELINNYISAYVDGRKKFERLFDAARMEMKTLDRDKYALMYDLQLWDGFNAGRWHEKLKTFVGIGTRDLFLAHGINLPKRNYRAFLVCPYYDVPGRISSILLLAKGGRQRRIDTQLKGLSADDGLMMMDSIPPRGEVVYAMSDPLFALRLQRRMANISDDQSLPIVVYGDKTTRAWQSVYASRVIFWSKESNDYALFSQSKQHPRALIATQPRFDATRPGLLHSMQLSDVTSQMRASAQSWASTVKSFILNGEFWQVSDFMINLALSAPDIQRVYDVCTPGEKQQVQKILGHTSRDRFFYVGNLKISESDDGWWITRGAERELGCNAIIRIEQAVHVVDTQENFYEGVVIFKGQQLKFSSPVNDMEKHPSDWLRDLLMNHIGVLRLSKAIASHLIEIAKQFHEPQYVRRLGKIGWNLDSQSFVFPNFSICDGIVDSSVTAKVLNASGVPAGQLYTPTTAEGDWGAATKSDHANAAVWAGLACFMGNMLAPAVGTSPQPIGFIGGSGSIGCIIGEHLVKELGMQSVVPKVMKNPLDEVETLNQRHDYPVWLDVASKSRKPVSYLHATDAANVAVHLLDGEAAALGVGESWVFVNAPRILAQSNKLPTLDGALAYLAWIQQRRFEMPNATSWQQSVLMSLQEWAFTELHTADEGVFTRAASMLRTFDADSTHQRLMHLIYWMLSNQKLRMAHGPFYDQFKAGVEPYFRAQIIFDDGHSKCYVRLNALRTAISVAKLSTPDYNSAVRSFAAAQTTTGFEQAADGFILSQSFWDSEVRRWRKIRA